VKVNPILFFLSLSASRVGLEKLIVHHDLIGWMKEGSLFQGNYQFLQARLAHTD
jgi:hypothetical protein